MSDMALNILLVEDNTGDAALLQEILADVPNAKFAITHVQRLSDALDKAVSRNFDVVLLDLSLPDCQGLDTVSRLRQIAPQLPILVLTGLNDEMLGSEAVRRGAQDYLVKGEVSGRLLSRSIHYATERARGEADLRAAHDSLEIRVRQRTAELEQALDALQDEVQMRTQTEEALRESEELFRQMAEATPEVFWIASPDMSKILYVNSSFERLWCQARSRLLHDPGIWMRQILPEDQSRVKRMLSHWLEEARRGDDEPLSVEYHLLRPDGERTMVHGRYFAIRDDRGRLLRVCGIVQDITERHNREQARRRLAAIVESTSDGIVSTSSDGLIQTWNAGAEKLLGYISAEAVGRSILTLVPPDRQMELADRLTEVRQKQTIDAFETACLRNDGQTIQVQVTFSPIVEPSGQLTAVSAIIRDVTERRMLQKRIIEVGEAERRRIGHDLHDTLGQMLTGLAFMMKVLTQKLHKADRPEAQDAAEVTNLLNQAITQARALARGLRQAELQADGFMTALKEYVQDAKKLFGVPCELQADTTLLVHDSAVATQLYHIVREAVTNAMKHSRATKVKIIIASDKGRHTLSVQDNGVGLPQGYRKAKGMGLQIMQYRAQMIGATLDISSKPQGGTVITCSLPVTEPQM